MKIEIWSDVVCPWCFVGKRNFEKALADFEHADQLEITWRSYELDPHGPPIREGTYAERVARKYGMEVGQARAAMARIINVGAEAGIEFKFDVMQPGNTFNAHRLLHLAARRGKQNELKEALFVATFSDALAIGTPEVLEEVAVSVGLDRDEVREVLDGELFGDEVRVDERVAQSIGITGVPFFLVDDAYGIPGAQDPSVYLNILERAWGETHRHIEIVASAGDACDDDVCDI
ncbi:MAG: DsbA family oxidoreductase [Acidimicrobiales bacterium]|nr:DsbA family oxidoreductase [Acidimicrobiales bacterium]